MINVYSINGKEISVRAHGSPNCNRIKNDLVWVINTFLCTRFELYTADLERKRDLKIHFPRLGFAQKYVNFQKLDSCFIDRETISDEDLECCRKMNDPKRKIADDVFREIFCMPNEDLEYVATDNSEKLFQDEQTFKSYASFSRWITSSFPVYISLFCAKEVDIIVNQSDLQEKILEIVLRYCEKEK